MIPGWLIALLTFPGVIIHEWAHSFICRLTGVRVQKTVYFRLGNPAGYVIHDRTDNYFKTFWISIGPLLINSFIPLVIGLIIKNRNSRQTEFFFLLWLAIAIGIHAFPSNDDMKNILNESKRRLRSGALIHILVLPFAALLYLANRLRFFWFDLLYAVILVYVGYNFLQ